MSDKLGPIEIKFVLDKQADEQAKKLKASLDAVGKSSKINITILKDAIKSLEGDIRGIEKLITSATPMAKNKGLLAELSRMKADLATEQGKLNELQKTGIEQDAKEEVSKNKIVESLKKWGIGLFTVGTALKITKAIINSTAGSAQTFQVIVAEATAGVGYFFKSIASGDWSNFGENLQKAIKGAKDYVDAMSIIADKQNELKVKSSEIDKEIAALSENIYDMDKKHMHQRQMDLTEIIKLEKQKYLGIGGEVGAPTGGEAKLAKDIYETNLKNAATQSGFAKDQIENFIKEYSSLEKMIELGKRWKKEFALIRESGTQAEIEAAQKASLFETKISKVTPETRAMLSDYMAAANAAESAFGSKMQRNKMQLGMVTKMINEEDEAAKKQAIEDAKLLNQLAKQYELLDKAAEDGDTAAMKSIADKIVLLKEELNVRTKIAQAAILVAYGGVPPKAVIPSIPNLYTGTRVTPGLQPASAEAQKGADLGKARQWNVDDIENLEKQKKLREEIVNAVADLINQIGQQIGLDEKSMALLNAGLNAFTSLAKGDLVGAAVSMLSGIIAQIPSAASRFAAQIEDINQLLEEQARLIELSERKGGQEQLRKDNLDTLNQKAAAEKAEYERLQNSADRHLDLLGWRQKKADEAYKTWQDTTNLIEDANQKLTDFYTTTTEYGIADAISQGFQDGKTSAADFAETFNGYMRTAINSALEEMSKPAIAAWTAKFAEDIASGGALTNAEIADLQKDWDKNIEDDKARRDAAYKIAGMDPTSATQNANSMQGAIRGVSEETASVLAGQVNNIRISQAESAGIMRQQLMHLANIDVNTRYCIHLEGIHDVLRSMQKAGGLRAEGLIG